MHLEVRLVLAMQLLPVILVPRSWVCQSTDTLHASIETCGKPKVHPSLSDRMRVMVSPIRAQRLARKQSLQTICPLLYSADEKGHPPDISHYKALKVKIVPSDQTRNVTYVREEDHRKTRAATASTSPPRAFGAPPRLEAAPLAVGAAGVP